MSGGRATDDHTCVVTFDSSELRITFPKEEYALYTQQALVVDKELRSDHIKKDLSCQGKDLVV